MAFRGNHNRYRNFVGGPNNYGGPIGHNRLGGMNMSPWESQSASGNHYENQHIRQGGGANSQALNFQSINNLLNNLLRNQTPPSLLDLPRSSGMGGGNRSQRGGQMGNRGSFGNHHRPNNRRGPGGGGFQNRGPAGPKATQKQQGSGGIRKQNAFDRAKKLLAKNTNNKKKESNNTVFSEDVGIIESHIIEHRQHESPYDSVSNDMFYCHLCKKHMWDATSFENHIKGRTHLMMREGIEESYRLKANMIRQEAKIAEQFKSIEFDRLKRMGKSKQRQLDYCTMCDLNFHGHISTHRKSDGHLQLKKFLHPKCLECNNEFPTRIDYDTHLLSAEHLKNAAEKNVKVGEHKRQTLAISTEEDELRDVRPSPKRRKKSVKKDNDSGDNIEVKETGAHLESAEEAAGECENLKDGEDGVGDGDETKEGDDMHDGAEDEDGEFFMPVDPENVILDFADGDDIPSEIDARLPKYNWTRSVGSGLILRLECFECSICGKFLDNERTAEVHSRTATHHRNFLKFINEKSSDTRIAQKRAAAALEASERKKIKLDEKKDDIINKDDLYDPSEATGDDTEIPDNGEGNEEENGNESVMEEKEEEEHKPGTEIEPESQPEPVKENPPVIQEVSKTPAKVVPVATTAAPTTPPNAAVSTNSASAKVPSPARKGFAAQRGGARGNMARNRGRGRYNRC